MAQIVTHSRWHQSAQNLDDLRKLGVQVVTDDPLKGLALKGVQYGETEAGKLTQEEATLYRAMADLKAEVDVAERGLQGDVMRRLGEAISNAASSDGPMIIVDQDQLKPGMEPEAHEAYFAKRQTLGYLHALFHWSVGERLGLHGYTLGVRGGGVIVKIAKRSPGE